MERFGRLPILVPILLLPWLGALPCLAQAPAPPPAAPAPAPPPPASQEVAKEALPPPRPTGLARIPDSPRIQAPIDPYKVPGLKSPLELRPPPQGEVINIPLPPPEAGDRLFPINLATALRLADARPIIVAAAQASAWIAEAKLQKAKVLWVPAFMFNAAYMRHDGYGPDFNTGINVPQGVNALGQTDLASFGKPLNQNFNWFITGGSFYQVVALTDAIFQPLASRQDYNAKRWDIQTAKNDALLETARSYFNVHKWRGSYAAAVYTVELGRQLVAAVNALKSDLIPAVEVDRARTLNAFLEQHAVSARESWRVSSADLTQVLRLDPRAVVEPLEQDHLQFTMIDPSRSLDDLIPIGLTNRPELASQQAMIQAALVRVRQEKLRPLIPIIMFTGWQTPGGMTTEFGAFATGPGGKMNNWSFRDDFSTQLVWQVQNMGFGNLALIKNRRGEASRATADLFHLQDTVVEDITKAQARLQSAAARVFQAERAVQTGLVTFRANLEGLGQTRRFENVLEVIYKPQEAVYALRLLQEAFDEYFATVAEYNTAQFELFHALGYPARELSFLREPGNVVPVDTTRPGFLPAVGIGPPPTTR